MDDLIDKLPEELKLEILTYTYQPQSKELCQDIINFHHVHNIILELYSERYLNSDEDKYGWISNDITRFMNKDLATLFFGYQQTYVDKICRLFLMKNKNKEEVTNFIIKLVDNESATFEINLRLAILKPEERFALVDFMQFEAQ